MAWGALSALLFHLHYLAALLLFLAEGFFLLLVAARRRWATREEIVPFAVAGAVAVALSLPAIPHFLYLLKQRDVLGLPPTRSFTDVLLQFDALYYIVLPLAVALVVRLLLPQRFTFRPLRAVGWLVSFLACWFLVPSLFAWVATWTGVARIEQVRYLSVCEPALPLAAGLALACLRPPAAWAYFVTAVLFLQVVIVCPLPQYARHVRPLLPV